MSSSTMASSCDSGQVIIRRRHRVKLPEACDATRVFDRIPPGSKNEIEWTPSGPDCISALPDDAIHHVLGFLPVHDAVQTSVLARGWRHHWRSMHSIRVTAVPGSVTAVVLKNLAGRLLLDLHAPLDECVIDIHGFWRHYEELDRLIRHAVSECHVRVLKVGRRHIVSGDPLVSRCLARLELHHVMVQGMILDFSSCTALTDLVISCSGLYATKISSQSLKRLRIDECYLLPVDSVTCISAPNIISLKLDDLRVTTPLLECMPLLETAFVKLGYSRPFHCKQGDTRYVCGVCEGCIEYYCMDLGNFASARHLELTAPDLKFTVLRCPTFSKLKTLLLNEWCVATDFRALICILQNSPILEKLTLQLNEGSQESYHAVEQLRAVSERLKVVEIKCMKVDERVYEILKMLSTFDIQINIRRTSRPTYRLSFDK